MEIVFVGLKKIVDWMGSFDVGDIVDYDLDKFVVLCLERFVIY